MTTSTNARADLAREGELLAARHLTGLGMVVLARNWRCREGEIDLVLRDGGCLVICEVKTRRGLGHGDPLEAISAVKVRRLRRLAGAFLAQWEGRGGFDLVRLDAVGILWPAGGRPQLRHVRAVGS